MGLRGGVQLEWYKRVVPAGRNKITCGGEQTNTLSSDNEHCCSYCTRPQGYALRVLSYLFLEHLVFSCLLCVADCALCVCVQYKVCTPCCVPTTLVALLARAGLLRTSRGNTCGHRRVLAAFFGPPAYFCAKSLEPSPGFRANGHQTSKAPLLPLLLLQHGHLPSQRRCTLQRNFSAASHA